MEQVLTAREVCRPSTLDTAASLQLASRAQSLSHQRTPSLPGRLPTLTLGSKSRQTAQRLATESPTHSTTGQVPAKAHKISSTWLKKRRPMFAGARTATPSSKITFRTTTSHKTMPATRPTLITMVTNQSSPVTSPSPSTVLAQATCRLMVPMETMS